MPIVRDLTEAGEIVTARENVIKVIGVGATGVRLLGTLMSLGLRQALAGRDEWPTRDLRFIAVETDIGKLAGTHADAGFYLGEPGECANPKEASERMSVRAQQVLAHELRGACLVLLLVQTGDALECAAAAGIAELTGASGAMGVSLVAQRDGAANGISTETASQPLARIRAASDVVLSFSSAETDAVGDICCAGDRKVAVHAGELVDCAHVLLKAITMPYEQLVGCDYQDVRTVLDTPLSVEDRLAGHATAFFHRIVTTLDMPADEIARAASENLPLKAASKVLIYLEGGSLLGMKHVRNIVVAIQDKLTGSVFVKYCVEKHFSPSPLFMAINIIVNTSSGSWCSMHLTH